MEMDERNPTERDESTEPSVKDVSAQPTQPEPTVSEEAKANAAEPTGDGQTKSADPAPIEPEKKPEERPRRRGFAAMDRDRVKEIASRGGRAAHAAGTAHQFSSDEARVAGKKGGEAPHVRRGGVRRRPTNEPAPTSQGQDHNDRR